MPARPNSVSASAIASPWPSRAQAVNETDANWWRNAAFDVTLEQNGNFLDSNFNTGVLFFRTSAAARAAVALWIGTIVSEGRSLGGAHAWDDQQAFGELMRVGPDKRYMLYPHATLVPGGAGRALWAMNGRVRLGVLPVQLFANGHTFFVQGAQKRPGVVQPFIVHNTFQFYGAVGKRARFAGEGLWWADAAEGDAAVAAFSARAARARRAASETLITWDPNPSIELRGTPAVPQLTYALEGLTRSALARHTAELRNLFWDDGGGRPQPGVASHMRCAPRASRAHALVGYVLTHAALCPRLVAYHLLCFRNVLAVAHITGRTLVIPRLPCHCDRYWFPILPTCRSPGAELRRPFLCTVRMAQCLRRRMPGAFSPTQYADRPTL